jgi:lantibiotic leader peptide-processing serine protease
MGRLLLAGAALAALIVAAAPATAAPERTAVVGGYVVLYRSDASLAAARLAVRAAGGTLVRENRAIGVATATSLSPTFAADLMRQGAIAGIARNKPVGYNAPVTRRKPGDGERLSAVEKAASVDALSHAGGARLRPSRSPARSGTWR